MSAPRNAQLCTHSANLAYQRRNLRSGWIADMRNLAAVHSLLGHSVAAREVNEARRALS